MRTVCRKKHFVLLKQGIIIWHLVTNYHLLLSSDEKSTRINFVERCEIEIFIATKVCALNAPLETFLFPKSYLSYYNIVIWLSVLLAPSVVVVVMLIA